MKPLLLFILIISILLFSACSGGTTLTNTITQPAEQITTTLTTTQPAQTVTDTMTSTITNTMTSTITITTQPVTTTPPMTTMTPAKDGFIRITCEEVFQMMGNVTNFKAVDARSRGAGMSGRLPNAVSIPNVTDTEIALEERQDNLKLLNIYI